MFKYSGVKGFKYNLSSNDLGVEVGKMLLTSGPKPKTTNVSSRSESNPNVKLSKHLLHKNVSDG